MRRGLADPSWFRAAVPDPRARWSESESSLNLAARFATGAVVAASDSWASRRSWLTSDRLVGCSVGRWRLDAWRNLAAARWLREEHPRLAVQAAFRAGAHALKALSTEAGFLFRSRKWVALELEAMQRSDLLDAHRRWLLATASVDADARLVDDMSREVEDVLGEPRSDVVVEVAYLPAVEHREIGRRTLVWRWDMDGVELQTLALPDPESPGAIWRGGIDDDPPDWLHELFRHDLVWMGACHGPV
jgi:hypothetical protein